MKRMKIVGLCLVAVFAFGAVGSTAALAHGPHWNLACHEVTAGEGRFQDNKCEVSGGTKNWDTWLVTGEKREITFKNIGNTTLKTPNSEVVCKKAAAEGAGNEIIGGWPGTDKATIKFTECTAKVLGEACTGVKSSGAAEGTIIVKVLTELVFDGTEAQATAETAPVGVLFKTLTNAEKTFVTLVFKGGLFCGLAGEKKVLATGTAGGANEGVAGVIGDIVEPAKAEVKKKLKFPTPPITKCWRYEGGVLKGCTAGLETNGEKAEQLGEAEVELVSKAAFSVDPK